MALGLGQNQKPPKKWMKYGLVRKMGTVPHSIHWFIIIVPYETKKPSW